MGVGAGTGDDLAKVAAGMPEQAGFRGAVQVKMNNGPDSCESARAQRRFTDFFGGVSRFGIDQGVFTTDGEWMGNGWDLRQLAWACYPDRIRVIRG